MTRSSVEREVGETNALSIDSVMTQAMPRRNASGSGRRAGGWTPWRHAAARQRVSVSTSAAGAAASALSTAASLSRCAPASSHAAAAPIASTGDTSGSDFRTSSIDGSTPAACVKAAKPRTSRPHHLPNRRTPAASRSVRRSSSAGLAAPIAAAASTGETRSGSAGADASISTRIFPPSTTRSAGREDPVYSALATASGKRRTV